MIKAVECSLLYVLTYVISTYIHPYATLFLILATITTLSSHTDRLTVAEKGVKITAWWSLLAFTFSAWIYKAGILGGLLVVLCLLVYMAMFLLTCSDKTLYPTRRFKGD